MSAQTFRSGLIIHFHVKSTNLFFTLHVLIKKFQKKYPNLPIRTISKKYDNDFSFF